MNWYNLTVEEISKKLNSSLQGLTSGEAKERIKKYGKNELPKQKTDSIVKIFFKQLLDPIVMLLVVTVIFSLVVNEVVDAVAIIFIILVDLLLGTYEEWKAKKTAEGLSKLIQVFVRVKREGNELEIESSSLVPGDIVYLESGSKISADMRIIHSHNFVVNESVLTGESVGVDKDPSTLGGEVSLSERKNMVYAGTSVLTGRATCMVVSTGLETEIGTIHHTVMNTKEEKSPLTIRMDIFSKQITKLIIAVAIIIAFVLFLKDVPGKEIFLSVIALSVSAMPEGLPLAMTMALSIASNRMAKKQVVVKKLNAVESLGSCTVIASDKTGTLTINEQTAKKVILPDETVFDIEGTGYNDQGKIISNTPISRIELLTLFGVLNNEAGLEYKNNKWTSFGDSIDIAFLALGLKAKVGRDDIQIIEQIPYESENKYSAVSFNLNNEKYITAKGSLEKMLEFSSFMRVGNEIVPIDSKKMEQIGEKLAKEGYRVIALASKKSESFSLEEMIFEGMVAFIDPIRNEVKESIKEAQNAGIKVLMITGDHPLTAYKIASDLELVTSEEEVATGAEVASMYEKGTKVFDEFIKGKRVFARVTPHDKLHIVDSLKRNGEFVAVTGDGVNDAPAIKSANIGISMGSGTDVAKETSSMILMNDNFTSIVAGIREGRCAYDNIRKISFLLLSCGLAEVLFFLLSIIFDLPMPLVAIQLLWLNIVTDGLQDLALSFERPEEDIMKRKPRDTKETIFNKELMSEVLFSGLIIGILVFGVWYYLLKFVNMEVATARGYIMVLMVFMQNIHVLSCRSEKHSAFSKKVPFNGFILFSILSAIVLQIIVMEVPVLSHFLKTNTVPIIDMIILFGISSIILVAMEIYKLFKRRA